MMIGKLSVLLLLGFIGACSCQYKPYATTTEWWDAYKSKATSLYTQVNAVDVQRWDIQRQQKKAAALAHLNTLETIDEACETPVRSTPNQGGAISCVLDQDQRLCEFGWIYFPLSTKKETCHFTQGLPHRGNCCTITVSGAGAGGIPGGG